MTTNTLVVLPDQTSYETDLVTKLRRGDAKTQYAVYKLYVDAMYHTVNRIVNNESDAQDVVQECFIKVFEKIGTFRADATLGAWIKRIAINSAYNQLRKRQRTPEFPSEDLHRYELEEEGSFDDVFISPELVHNSIKALPSGCRTILSLYALEGYSHKEIAEIMDITESTSKTQYRRGKSLLKQILKSKID